MTDPHTGAVAFAWAGQGDREATMAALASLPPAEALVDDLDRAFAGAALVRIGRAEAALRFLQHDWARASCDSAGLAGAALLALGLIDQALPALHRAVSGTTRDPAAHQVNLGRALILLNRAEEALPHLRSGLGQASHDRPIAQRSLAEALLALGRSDEALACLPADADDAATLCARAAVLAAAFRHEEAAGLLRDSMGRLPEERSLILMASELAEVRGRVGEAVELLRRALDKDPDNVALWARLTQTGRLGKMSEAARAAAIKALALAEGKDAGTRALAQCAWAHVLSSQGDVIEAEAAWRQALDLAPSLVPALSGLGHLLMQVGQVEEAIGRFRQICAAAPLQGWSQLIHAREVPDDPQVLENMERAARQPGLEGPVRTGLLFTLAAAWDRKKNNDRAMRLAREANDASKHLLPYRPEEHRARVGREMALFSKAFLSRREGWGNPSRLPVFVLGMPRSGTTLVEQILGGHSEVHGAGELGQVGELIQRLLAWEARLGSGIGYPDLAVELTREDLRRQGERMLKALKALAPDGAAHVIDKLPHNFEHIGLIKLVFPNATIFHVRREPRDIAVSNYITDYAAKFGGMGFAYDLGWIGEQLVDHDRLMAHWHRVFPGQILEVPYEELVEDTEGWARKMLAHLGVPWEPQVLDFQDLDRPVKTASVWQVRQPVYKTSKARWRRYEAHLGALEDALSRIPSDPAPRPLPLHPPGLFDTGMAALQAGRPAEAELAFRALIEAHPRHAAGHHFLGAALVQQGRAPEGVIHMRHSIRLWPRHASWFDNLAGTEAALGNHAEAEKARGQSAALRARPL